MNLSQKKILTIVLTLFTLVVLSGCNSFRMTDAREVSPNPDERVQDNINKGKGLRLGALGNQGNGNFQFASSNPLWRASLDVLDFAPLLSANYSGGVIISDWVNTDTESESFKITVKFLSNEIRPDGLKIDIHQKICSNLSSCKISKLETSITNDLKIKILKRAALYQNQDFEKLNEDLGEYQIPPIR
jgi:hypothetical protein